MSELPDTLYVQDSGAMLLVNRTPLGALRQRLGPLRRPGESVGVYRLEKMVTLQLAADVVQAPAPEPTTAVTQ